MDNAIARYTHDTDEWDGKRARRLWTYVSPAWAGRFLDQWCRGVMRTRLDPMKKFARSMCNHRELILN